MVKKSDREKWFYIFMTLVIAVIIFLSSSIPTPLGEKTGLNLAAIYHFGVFFMLTFFLTLSLKKRKLDNQTIAIIILLSLAYAISDEAHQLFVVGRFASAKDVLIDLIGSAGAVLILKLISFYRKI